jgi:hypothetical protein
MQEPWLALYGQVYAKIMRYAEARNTFVDLNGYALKGGSFENEEHNTWKVFPVMGELIPCLPNFRNRNVESLYTLMKSGIDSP